jgi:hypothetical protein
MNTKFYIKDTTVKKVEHFDSVAAAVKYLEGVIKRITGQTRAQFMQQLAELGHGYDDRDGVTFTRAMAEKVEI